MITYKGKEYWSTELTIPGRGQVTIASTELSEILEGDITNGSKKDSEAAIQIDETIYYYLDEEEQQMPMKKMIKYINGETS